MSNTSYLYKIAQAQLASIALKIVIQAAESSGDWDLENPWVNRIKGRFAKSGTDVAIAISEAAKFGAEAALAEEKAFLASQVFGINVATSKASGQIADTLSPISSIASTQAESVISTIQNTSTQITENVLTGADNISGGSDLGSAILGSEGASERIGRIGNNLLQLASDVSSVTLAGFAIAAEKAVEADTGRDIKSMGDIKEELDKASDVAISEESTFLNSQGEGLKNLAERVSNSVTPFFTTNVEAYYEERSEAGKKQSKVVREILQRAKEINEIKIES